MDPLAAGLGILNTGYNLYTNKRDFDYQKAIQQQMFEREDTAIQRRMADLQAAGLNPSLAGGQGAGAGAVVSRSNTNDVDMGSALDMLQAVNQIKLQKQEQENKILENKILSNQKKDAEQNQALNQAKVLKELGFNDIDIQYGPDKNGEWRYTFWYNDEDLRSHHPLSSSNLWKNLDYAEASNSFSSKILEGEAGWQGVQNTIGIIGKLLGIFK